MSVLLVEKKDERCGCILRHKTSSEVLTVLNDASGKWGFPKGKRERRDTSRVAAAQRETKEEVGIHVDEKQIEQGQCLSYKRHHYFLVDVDTKLEPKIDGREIRAAKWQSLTDLAKLPMSTITVRILQTLGVHMVVNKHKDTEHKNTQHKDTRHKDTQHKDIPQQKETHIRPHRTLRARGRRRLLRQQMQALCISTSTSC